VYYILLPIEEAAQLMTDKQKNIRSEDRAQSKFHWLFTGYLNKDRQPCDTPILETDNFVVLPSLGSIVPGWLLIVPKSPTNRIADIDPATRIEFEDLVERSKRLVEARYGACYLFENGG